MKRMDLLTLVVVVVVVVVVAGAGAELIDPLRKALPELPGFDWDSAGFVHRENAFDPVYSAIELFWTIEAQGTRSEALHGMLVLDAGAVDPIYRATPALAANSWVSLGFGLCMLNAEFIMVHGTADGERAELEYLISKFDYAAPASNPGPNISVPSSTPYYKFQGNGLVAAEFKRYTKVSDEFHKSLNVNELNQFIWAFKIAAPSTKAEPYKYWHGGNNRGKYSLQLSLGTPSFNTTSPDMPNRYRHGAAMGFCWMVAFPFAIFWARFGKSIPRLNVGWMWVHIAIQVAATIVSVSYIIVMINTIPDLVNWGTGRFYMVTHPHSVIGFIILFLILLQLLIGPLNRLSLTSEFLHPYRELIKSHHRWIGRITLVTAFVQVGLGLQVFFPFPDGPFDDRGGIKYWTIYFVLLGFWSVLFVAAEAYYIVSVRMADGGFISKRTGKAFNAGSALASVFSSTANKPTKGHDVSNSTLLSDEKGVTGFKMSRNGFGRVITGSRPEDMLNPLSSLQARMDMTGVSGGVTDAAVTPNSSEIANNVVKRSGNGLPTFTWQDIDDALHQGQLYVVAKGRYVYDINKWIYSHPGGQVVLNQVAGTDITSDYFHESGFDAAAFVAKDKMPAYSATRSRVLPSALQSSTIGGVSASGSHLDKIVSESSDRPTMAPPSSSDLAGVPPLSDAEWKLVLKARRTNVHSRLAIEKLSSLMVGEIAGAASYSDEPPSFDPFEYRRYALIESSITGGAHTQNPIYRLRLCVLFPHDVRRGEPQHFLPGQNIEVQIRTRNGEYVSRFFTPLSGTLACFEMMVKLEPAGKLTPVLVRQKLGDRQIKIRGPFGTPFMSPERPLAIMQSGGGSTWSFEKVLFVVGGSGLTPALHFVEWTLMPRLVPLMVIQAYDQQAEDELQLAVGDWVVTKEHLFDGWAIGTNLRTGEEGLFPLPVTMPRTGVSTKISVINSLHTADDAFGSDLLRGAQTAYPPYIAVTHLLTRGVGSLEGTVDSEDELQEICPGQIIKGTGRIQIDLLQSALQDLNYGSSNPALRKVVVCGPPQFMSVVYEILVDSLEVDHSEIMMLPSDSCV